MKNQMKNNGIDGIDDIDGFVTFVVIHTSHTNHYMTSFEQLLANAQTDHYNYWRINIIIKEVK